MSRMLLVLLALLFGLLTGGCRSRMFWDYHDDPYFADYAALDDDGLRRSLRSVYSDDRTLTLRVIAHRAASARTAGEDARARLLEEDLVEAYRREKDPAVREEIIRVCAPLCGRGSPRIRQFLRERVADGEFRLTAALALAGILGPHEADVLLPLLRHPSEEVRFAGAQALTVLGSPEAQLPVQQVLAEMQTGSWPRDVAGMPLAQAREHLAARARRVWGAPMPLRSATASSDLEPYVLPVRLMPELDEDPLP